MKRAVMKYVTIATAISAMALLAGCGGDGSNPFQPGGDTPTDPGTPTDGSAIPETLAGNVTSIRYDATTQRVVVEGVTLDEVPYLPEYERNAALDANYNGYQVYTAQDDPLDRHSTAVVLQSSGTGVTGRVRAGAVQTGGPRNRYFGGTYWERDGAYDAPDVSKTSGLVSYAGNYIGLTNVGVRDGMLLPVDPGTPEELTPSRAAQVTGDIYLSADFADNQVEGNIYNRVLVPTGQALPSIVLVATGIGDDGTFSGGEVEYDSQQQDPFYVGIDPTIGNDIGDYAGVFAGQDSKSVGGGVRLEQWDGPNDMLGYDQEEEYGTFVLEQCGTAFSNQSICDQVKP